MCDFLNKFRRDEGGFVLVMLLILIGLGGVIELTFYPSFQRMQKHINDELSVLCVEGGKLYAVNHYSGIAEEEARFKLNKFASGYLDSEFGITTSSSSLPDGVTININPLDVGAARNISPNFHAITHKTAGSTNLSDIIVMEGSDFEYESMSTGGLERFYPGVKILQGRFTLYEVEIVSKNKKINENVAAKVSDELKSALPKDGVKVGCIVGAYKTYQTKVIKSSKGKGLPITSLFWYHDHVRDALTESGLRGNYYRDSQSNIGICRSGDVWLNHRLNFYHRSSSLSYDGKSVVFEPYDSPNLVKDKYRFTSPATLYYTPPVRGYWNYRECLWSVMPNPNRDEVDGAEVNESKYNEVNAVNRGALALSSGDRWGNTMSRNLFPLNEPEKWVFFSFYKGIPDPIGIEKGDDPAKRQREGWSNWFGGASGDNILPGNRNEAQILGRGFVPGYPGKVKCNNFRPGGIGKDFISYDVELTEKTVEEYMKKHGYIAWRASPEFVNMLASGFYAKDWPETTAELMAEPATRPRRDIPIRYLGDWSNDPEYQDKSLAQKLLTGSYVFDDGRRKIWTPYLGSLPTWSFNAGIGTVPSISAQGIINNWKWVEFAPWIYSQARHFAGAPLRDRAFELMDTTIPNGLHTTIDTNVETAGFSHSYHISRRSYAGRVPQVRKKYGIPGHVSSPSYRSYAIPINNGYAFDYNWERILENGDDFYRYASLDKCATRNPFWPGGKNVCALFFKVQYKRSLHWGWISHRNIGFSTVKNPAMYAEYEDCTGDGTNVPIEEIPSRFTKYSISSNANAFVLSSRN